MNLIQLTERVKLVDVNTLLLSMEGTRDDEIMTIADVSRTLTQGTGVCNVVAAGGAEPTSLTLMSVAQYLKKQSHYVPLLVVVDDIVIEHLTYLANVETAC